MVGCLSSLMPPGKSVSGVSRFLGANLAARFAPRVHNKRKIFVPLYCKGELKGANPDEHRKGWIRITSPKG
jgi:hypothetical protein